MENTTTPPQPKKHLAVVLAPSAILREIVEQLTFKHLSVIGGNPREGSTPVPGRAERALAEAVKIRVDADGVSEIHVLKFEGSEIDYPLLSKELQRQEIRCPVAYIPDTTVLRCRTYFKGFIGLSPDSGTRNPTEERTINLPEPFAPTPDTAILATPPQTHSSVGDPGLPAQAPPPDNVVPGPGFRDQDPDDLRVQPSELEPAAPNVPHGFLCVSPQRLVGIWNIGSVTFDERAKVIRVELMSGEKLALTGQDADIFAEMFYTQAR